MDVERTIQFLLENAAQSDARWAARDARWSARMDRLEEGHKKNQLLTVQLIGLMSQQTAHHVKLARETDRRFKETDKQIKETWEVVRALGKRIDAFVAASARTNGGRGRKT